MTGSLITSFCAMTLHSYVCFGAVTVPCQLLLLPTLWCCSRHITLNEDPGYFSVLLRQTGWSFLLDSCGCTFFGAVVWFCCCS